MVEIDPVEGLERALRDCGALFAGIADDQWPAATGCDGWDVRHLANHLVSGNFLFASLLTDGPPVDRMADHLGDDAAGAFRRSADELLAAFGRPGAFERQIQAPVGLVPGHIAVHLRTTEALVHGWDLAQATAQPPALPDDVAAQELVFSRRMLGQVPREGRFAPEQPVPEGASALEQLVALLGRPVGTSR